MNTLLSSRSARLFLAAVFVLTSAYPSFAAPTITATQDDATLATARKAVGDTITYTTTITNGAAVGAGNEATGVTLTNPTPLNTTDFGTVSISPIAFDDVYPQNVVANIGIDSSQIPYSVFTNDSAGTPAVTTIASFTQPAHGTVTMVTSGANAGRFTYQPAPGYTGTDSFTYTLTNAVGSSVGTVSLNVVGPVVWFANDDAAAGGNGTLAAPFQTLAAANTAATASGNRIFLFSGNYTGGITLVNGVLLYGQGVGGTSFDTVVLGGSVGSGTIARPAINGTDPVITTTVASTNAINIPVGASNTIAGLTIGNKTGSGIATATNFGGTLTVVDTTINGTGQALLLNGGTVNAAFDGISSSSGTNGISLTNIAGTFTIDSGAINGPTGADFLVNGGTASITFPGTITNAAGRSIDIQNKTGGTVTFSGAISDTGAGIFLNANTGATFTFSGGVTASTGANPALTATAGGTVSVCDRNPCGSATAVTNTLTTTTGTALNVANTTIGSSGLIFQSINSPTASANAGIILNNTGTSGGLTVNGTGTTAGTGGTISNKTGNGVDLRTTRNVTLKNMNLTSNAQTNGEANPVNCGVTGPSGGNVNCTAGAYLGTVNGITLDNVNINGSNQNGINGLNVVDLKILNSTVQNAGNESGENGVFIQNLTGLNCALTNSTFQNNNVQQFGFVNFTSGALGTSASPFNVSNCTFIGKGNTVTPGGDGFQGRIGGTSTGYISIGGGANSPSSFRKNYSYGVFLDAVSTGNATFIVNGCNFGTGGAANYNNSGIAVGISGGSTVNYTFSNNIITGIAFGTPGNGVGIIATTGLTTAGASIIGTISGNTVGENGVSGSGGFGNAAAMQLLANGGGPMIYKATVSGNHIWNPSAFGIQYIGGTITGAVTGTLHITGNDIHTDNVIAGTTPTPVGQAIAVAAAASGTGGAVSTLCADISGNNNITGTWDGANGDRIRVTTLRGSVYTVGGMPGSGAQTAAAVTAFIGSQNSAAPPLTSGSNTASGGGTFNANGGAVCAPLLLAPGGISAAPTSASLPTDSGSTEPVSSTSTETPRITNATSSQGNKPAEGNDNASALVANSLTQSQLDVVVAAAIQGWEKAGLSAEQSARLQSLQFEVATLPDRQLGEANANHIRVNSNAGGNGWFLGGDDAAFSGESTRRYTTPTSAPAGRIDLLTTIMHEMGHALGLSDSYLEQDRDSVMYGFLSKGERRFPAKGQAIGANPNALSGPHFLGSPLNIGTLPPGKSVKIVYSVTVGPITGNPQSVSSQAVISGSNFTSVNAVDAVAGSGPTNTLLAIPPTITSANATTFTVGSNGSFGVSANGAPGPAYSHTGTLPSGVTLSAVGLLSGTPAAGTGGTYPITITANNGIAPNATQSFTLTVNQPAAITSANSATFVVGTAGSFTVTKTGFPAPTLSQTGTLPSGVTFDPATGVLSGTPAAGSGGSYPITFTAANGVGTDATQNFTLTVNEASSITSANSTTFTVGTAGTFTVTKSGFPAPTLSQSGTLPSGVTFTPATGVLSGTPAAGTGGTYPITFTASNGIGSNAVQNFTLTVNQAAAITSGNATTFTVGTAGSFTVTRTGFPAPTLSVTGTLPSGVTFDSATGVLGGTPAAGTGGTYSLTFTAANGVGTDATQNFTLTVNQPSAITSTNATSFTVGTAGSFTVTKTGFPAPTLSQSGTLPSGVTFTAATGVLSGTPAAGTGGTYPITFTATNGIGSNAVQNFTLTVNQPAAITSANSTTFTVGSAGSFTVTTSGFPTATITRGGDALPANLTFVDNGNGTATLSGAPASGTGGVYNLTINASNGFGAGEGQVGTSQAFTLTVNEAAAITSANSTTFTVGTAGSFTVTKTGFPAPTLSQSGTLPSGVTFDPMTGVLSGTPVAGTGGTYPLNFTASNGVGADAMQSFTLTVSEAAAITSPSSTTFVVGTAGTFTVTASGSPTPAIAIGGDPLPANVAFVDNGDGTATLSGTPAPGTGGTYNLTFTPAGGAAQNFTLTVNEAPSITSANSATFTVGNFGSFTMTAEGFPAPTFSATGTLPSAVTLAPSGVLSGTPDAGTAGTYPLQVTAANGIGTDDVEAFTLTVNDAICVAPVADLIAWYPAEANAVDVKNGHDGTPSGGAGFAAGKVGQAFTFSGGSAVVSIPDDVAWDFGAAEFTIATWVKFNAPTNEDVFVGHSNGSGPNNKWIFWRKNGSLAFHLEGSAVANIASDVTFTPTAGQWYHVAVTRSGNTYKFYVDGVQNGTDRFDSNSVPDANAPLTLGNAEALTALNGALDEVQIFSRRLLATEVQSIYNASTEGFCVDALTTVSAVSRKTHGMVGDFDVILPLTGDPAVESRVGATPGNHKIVVTFNNPVTEATATVSAGSVSGTPTFDGSAMTIDLTGVANAQLVTVTLTNVKDAFAQTLPSTAVSMNVLVGDSTGNKAVTASDIAQTKGLSGDPVDATKFRCDFNTDGSVGASDVSQVKTAAGTLIP